MVIYFNWKWNYFREYDRALAEDRIFMESANIMDARRTQHNAQFGVQHRGVDVGFLGERPSWKHLRNLKSFIQFIRS